LKLKLKKQLKVPIFIVPGSQPGCSKLVSSTFDQTSEEPQQGCSNYMLSTTVQIPTKDFRSYNSHIKWLVNFVKHI
ncbi:hypothetical protein GWI33_016142, partial [Rhynchophorus ferrugineus]